MWSRTFAALQIANYRRYFLVQCVSTIGTWIQLVAENWLVLQLTRSGLALGITTALQFTPLLVIGAYCGVLVDRVNKRHLLMLTQSLSGILALAVGVLSLTGLIHVWMVWLAAILLGVVNSLDNPARQAFTREMVGRGEITNAIGLNNAVTTAGRAVGPAMGGLIIAAIGSGWCFLINAATFLIVVIMLAVVRTAELHSLTSVARTPAQIREGLRHAWQTPPLRAVLVILTIGGVFGTNFQVLLPLITSQTFGQGPATYGLLMGAMGIGSVAGSLITASTGPPSVRRIAAYAIAFGLGLAAVGAAPVLGVAFVAVALMGVGFGTFIPSCSAALQVNSADAMLGRIMALYTIAFLGTAPIGGPAIGGLAQAFGPREGFLAGAAGCIAAALLGVSATRKNEQYPRRQKRIFTRPPVN